MATLSRSELASAIQAGGVVLLDGQFVHRVEDLPSESEFAKKSGDASRMAAARELLLARKQAIDAEIAAIEAGTAEPEKPGVAEPEKPAPAPSLPKAELDKPKGK